MPRVTRHDSPIEPVRQTDPPIATSSSSSQSQWPGAFNPNVLKWALPLLVMGLVFAVFSPALRNELVNWDDDINLVHNEAFRGFSGEHLAWMFSTRLGGHCQPLTWLSFAADHALWGPPDNTSAFGYHLTNILLHALAAVIFLFVARRLLRAGFGLSRGDFEVESYWCAGLAALIFALHPLRVESVAWATERRDVLSAVFLFACVLAYLRGVQRDRRSMAWLSLSLLLLGLSLLSKAAGMTLPLILLVLDVYPLRRVQRGRSTIRQIIIEKIPFALLAGAAAFVAARAQQAAETWRSLDEFGVAPRIATACYGAVFYVWKFFTPTRLAPLYPLPPRDQLLGVGFILCAVVVIVAITTAIVFRRRFPMLLASLLVYLLFLAPVSGLAQSGKQLVAERYSYFSLLPLSILLAAGLFRLWSRRGGDEDGVRVVRTFQALAVLFVVGIGALSAAQTTRWQNSLELWKWGVQSSPNSSVALVNLADALSEQGQYDMAVSAYAQALTLDESDPKAHNGLGVALLRLNRPDLGAPALVRGVQLDPDNPHYRCNLGYAYAGFSRFDDAIEQYQTAIQIEPDLLIAYQFLAEVQIRAERFNDARDTMIEGLRRQPRDRTLRGNLAWLLATCRDDSIRNGEQALSLATDLCEEDGFENPRTLDTLAAAWAQVGDFGQAIKYAEMAKSLIPSNANGPLASEIAERLARYESHEPYRE